MYLLRNSVAERCNLSIWIIRAGGTKKKYQKVKSLINSQIKVTDAFGTKFEVARGFGTKIEVAGGFGTN